MKRGRSLAERYIIGMNYSLHIIYSEDSTTNPEGKWKKPHQMIISNLYRNKGIHGAGGWIKQQETPSVNRAIRREYALQAERH